MCFDLKSRFGKTYRVVSEDGNSRNTDPWNWQLLCRKGHVYPHSDTRLGAATDTAHAALLRRLLAIPSAQEEQLGDDGANISFDLADFTAVAKIMRPRRRRQLTAKQKAAAVDRLRKYSFAAAQSVKTCARRADARRATEEPVPECSRPASTLTAAIIAGSTSG
jgi:hypothetical protein